MSLLGVTERPPWALAAVLLSETEQADEVGTARRTARRRADDDDIVALPDEASRTKLACDAGGEVVVSASGLDDERHNASPESKLTRD